MRFAIALMAFLLPSAAFACEDVGALLQEAYPSATASDDGLRIAGKEYSQTINLEETACKVWPSRPDLALLAVPLIEAEPAVDGETRGDVEIIVADLPSKKPLARRLEEGMAFADAIQFRELQIDTARYDVRMNQRAFGVVTRQNGSSRVNPYSESALWLYTFADGRIERLLDGLIVHRNRGENDGNCNGESDEVSRTIAIGVGESDGYRDLVIEQTEKAQKHSEVGPDCQVSEVRQPPSNYLLSFIDGRYRPADKSVTADFFSSIEIVTQTP